MSLPSAGRTCGNHESSIFCAAILCGASSFREAWNYMRLGQKRIAVMSAPLVVSIPHSLGREEAMRRLKTGLSRAATSVPMLSVDEERWEDNRMIFRVRAMGQAATGNVDVADDHVRVEVVLPWLLQRFAEVAQAAIRNAGKLLLTKTELRFALRQLALPAPAWWRRDSRPSLRPPASPSAGRIAATPWHRRRQNPRPHSPSHSAWRQCQSRAATFGHCR